LYVHLNNVVLNFTEFHRILLNFLKYLKELGIVLNFQRPDPEFSMDDHT